MNLRHRHTGEGAVAVDEAKEAAGRLPDDLYALPEVTVVGHVVQGVAERDYGRDGIEHLVGDNPGHLLPLGALGPLGLGAALGLLLEDVETHGGISVHDGVPPYLEIIYPHLGAYRHFQRPALLQSLDTCRQSGHQPVQVGDVPDDSQAEDRGQRPVAAAHLPGRSHSQQAGPREILHGSVEDLVLVPEPLLFGDEVPHPVEQDVEDPVLEKCGVLGKMEGQVSVLKGAQQVVELADIAAVYRQDAVDQHGRHCPGPARRPVPP